MDELVLLGLEWAAGRGGGALGPGQRGRPSQHDVLRQPGGHVSHTVSGSFRLTIYLSIYSQRLEILYPIYLFTHRDSIYRIYLFIEVLYILSIYLLIEILYIISMYPLIGILNILSILLIQIIYVYPIYRSNSVYPNIYPYTHRDSLCHVYQSNPVYPIQLFTDRYSVYPIYFYKTQALKIERKKREKKIIMIFLFSQDFFFIRFFRPNNPKLPEDFSKPAGNFSEKSPLKNNLDHLP